MPANRKREYIQATLGKCYKVIRFLTKIFFHSIILKIIILIKSIKIEYVNFFPVQQEKLAKIKTETVAHCAGVIYMLVCGLELICLWPVAK